MQFDSEILRKLLSKDVTDFLIRIGLVAILVVLSLQIITPFANLLLWGLILAVSLFPLHQRLAKFLRGRQGLSATLLVIAGLIIIGTPTIMLGGSFADQVQRANTAFENDEINIKAPDAAVAEWPLIGERVHGAWTAAADDLPSFLSEHKLQLQKLSKGALSAAASTAASIFLFLGSLVIAGIMMAYAESGGRVILRILSRLTDPIRGPQLQGLSVATIRSVATGVVGYLWWAGDASTTSNILLSIYLLVAGMADNFLKPLLLGRGVDVPMPVVLLGALGGMVSAGIIGLFVGAVVLSVAYKIFMAWVDSSEEVASE
jgi:predicted PurR-regulated permease PerM